MNKLPWDRPALARLSIALCAANRRLLMLLVASPLVLLAGERSPVSARDHLIPLSDEIDSSYREILRRRLLLTPADFGRITSLGGGRNGEVSIAFHTDNNSKTGASVTYTKAGLNFGNATWESNPDRVNEASIKVTRSDLPFSRATAQAISEVVGRALARTNDRPSTGRAQDMVFDGLRVVFR